MSFQDMADKPLVTVAMAVYNGMPYLPESIDNILNQDYVNIDFLIIDDGSTDKSRDIIKCYSEQNSHIRYIFKNKNEGLSSVRNLSIIETKGEYLLMVDSDDLMNQKTVSKAVSLAQEEIADVVIWDYDTFCGQVTENTSKSKLDGFDVANRHSLLKLPAFMPIRLWRKEYLLKEKIKFPLGLTKQDIPVYWHMVTDKNCRIAFLKEILFHYRQHKSSTSSQKGRSIFALARVMDIVEEDLMSRNIYQEYKNDFLNTRLSLLYGMYDMVLPKYKNEAIRLVKERLNEQAVKYLRSPQNGLSTRVKNFYAMLQGNCWGNIKYHIFLLTRFLYRKFNVR